MAVKKSDELLKNFSDIVGENNEDNVISFIEDLTDTLNNVDTENWKEKFETNDAEWRKKYRERFLDVKTESESESESESEPEDGIQPKDFEDLFEEVGKENK
nr:MAG TPA: hypothetical protein [Caudoviricetes sp.]